MGVRWMAKRRRGQDGFTLIELVVVIAIVAILVAAVLWLHAGYVKKTAQAALERELEAVLKAAQIASAWDGGVTEIRIDPDGVVTIEDTPSQRFYDKFERYFQWECRVEEISTVDCSSIGGPGDSYHTVFRLTLLDFTASAAGTDYENGAVWTGSDGWEPVQ